MDNLSYENPICVKSCPKWSNRDGAAGQAIVWFDNDAKVEKQFDFVMDFTSVTDYDLSFA